MVKTSFYSASGLTNSEQSAIESTRTDAEAARDAAQAAQAASESSLTSFQTLYLGASPSDPTSGPNGASLVLGCFYFNTETDNTFMFNGTSFVNISNVDLATNSASGLLSASGKVKLDGIESGATGDQTSAEIRSLVAAATDSNVFTDAFASKLNAIESGATGDQTAAEIRTLVGNATDSNVYTDVDTAKVQALDISALMPKVGGSFTGDVTLSSSRLYMSENQKLSFDQDDGFIEYTTSSSSDVPSVLNISTGDLTKANSARIQLNAMGATNLLLDSDETHGYKNITTSSAFKVTSGLSQSGSVAPTTYVTLDSSGISTSGNITVSGTVDGRDVSADGIKLDTISSNADVTATANVVAALTAGTNISIANDGTISASGNQTASEIRALVESASDSNVFTDADHSKLNGIEASATADQTKADIDALNINADQVDGFHASSFLRSDANDTMSGDLTVTGSVTAASLAISENQKLTFDGDDAFIQYTTSSSSSVPSVLNISTADLTKANSARITLNAMGGTNLTLDDSETFASKPITTNSSFKVTSGLSQSGSLSPTTYVTLDSSGISTSGNITVSGTVDGRDVATDGTKLDGIEASATADQTAAEIRTLVESASDSNVFTDADHTKLNGIEASATADQTASEIRALVESASDSNVFTDADHTKLNGIATGATNVTNTNQLTNGAGFITSADGGNAATLDSIDSTSFLRSDTSDDFSGGTLNFTGATNQFLLYNGSANSPYLAMMTSGTYNGYFQAKQDGETYLWNSRANRGLQLTTALKWYNGSTYETVWSESSDGSGSGLDADLLDGVHLSGIVQRDFQQSGANLHITSDYTGTAGILMKSSSGAYRFQIYGTGTQYGFLDGNWGNWDIQKTVNSYMTLRIGGSDYGVVYEGGTTFTGEYPVAFRTNTNEVYSHTGVKYSGSNQRLTVTGEVSITSDENLKEDIVKIEDPVAKLEMINGYNFTFKDSKKQSAGVLAQEIEKVMPELVSGEETKTVNYNGLIGLLIEAVKNQQAEINMLKERINA